MANTENKVQFNLKNVHYAKMLTSGEVPTWSTPVKVPGAVSLTLNPQGEVTPFYADGIVYYRTEFKRIFNSCLKLLTFYNSSKEICSY